MSFIIENEKAKREFSDHPTQIQIMFYIMNSKKLFSRTAQIVQSIDLLAVFASYDVAKM
jgi:hypothetical protein